MRVRIGKRGQEAADLVSVIVVFIVLSIFFLTAFSFLSSTNTLRLFQLEFLTTDNALMLDTLSAVPGDAILTYPLSTQGFALDINSEGTFSVNYLTGPFPNYGLSSSKDFIRDPSHSFPSKTLIPKTDDFVNLLPEDYIILQYRKTGREIDVVDVSPKSFTAQRPPAVLQQQCPAADMRGAKPLIAIDTDFSRGGDDSLKRLSEIIRAKCSVAIPKLDCNADPFAASLRMTLRGGASSGIQTATSFGDERSVKAGCLIRKEFESKGLDVAQPVFDSGLAASSYIKIDLEIDDKGTDTDALNALADAIVKGLSEHYSAVPGGD